MTEPTRWTRPEAFEHLGEDLRRLLLLHTSRTTYWENEPITYCVRCTPKEEQHRLEAVKWPCQPLLDAGVTIRDAGMLHTGEGLGIQSTRDERQQLKRWREILYDLDRCPHGRHSGDQCAGWRGPGHFEGGCRGGRSLGNPALNPGKVIGTNLGVTELYIVPISRETRHLIEAWTIPITDGRLLDAYTEDDPETVLAQTRLALLDANRALYALQQGPFLPGQGQLPFPTAEPTPMPQLDQAGQVDGK